MWDRVIDTQWLPGLSNHADVELHMQSDWRDAYVPVTAIVAGTDPGTWNLMSNRLHEVSTLAPEAAAPTYSRPFYVENAAELLDVPGEWYFSRPAGVVRYLPRADETMESIVMVAPRLENLLVIAGRSLDNKVMNVRIEGIHFAHTAWNAPHGTGGYGWQAGLLARPSNAIPEAAVKIDNAAPVVGINSPRVVGIRLTDILELSAAVSDDGYPSDNLFIQWRQGAGSGTVSFSRTDIAERVSLCFSIADTYTVMLAVDDGEQTAADSITVTVNDTGLGPNFALDRPATASSVWSETAHPPEDAVDGDINTIWHPGYGDFAANWWTVDLGESKDVGRIEIVSRQAYDQPDTRRHFIVEGGLAADFSDAKTLGFQGPDPFPFKGTWTANLAALVPCRYLRYKRSVSGNSTIAEFRAFGVAGERVRVNSTVAAAAPDAGRFMLFSGKSNPA